MQWEARRRLAFTRSVTLGRSLNLSLSLLFPSALSYSDAESLWECHVVPFAGERRKGKALQRGQALSFMLLAKWKSGPLCVVAPSKCGRLVGRNVGIRKNRKIQQENLEERARENRYAVGPRVTL